MSSLDHNFDQVEKLSPIASAKARLAMPTSWLERTSLSKKLNLAVFGNTMVLAMVAVVMLLGTQHLGGLGQQQAIIASVEVRSNNAAIALVDVVEGLREAEPGQNSEGIEQARENLTVARQALSDPIDFAGENMPPHLGVAVHGFRDRIDDLSADIGVRGAAPSDLSSARSDAELLYRDVSVYAVDLHDEAAGKADILFSRLSVFMISFIVLVIVGVAISLIGARRIIKHVSGSIRAVTGSMERLAEGDLSAHIPGAEREDEIGAMARALGVFRENSLELREVNAKRASDAEDELAAQRSSEAEKAKMIGELAEGFESSVGEVIAAVGAASSQLKSTSQSMAAMADQSANQSGVASQDMERVANTITAAAAATDEFALSINEVSKQASASAELARDASQVAGTANSRMGELSEAASEIGEIVELIQSIAQRTNLLALNASIEAARGGEAGRGFAVVASEVKELARQTSDATASVVERIEAIQNSTGLSVSDINSVVGKIAELEQAAVVIASAVDQQSTSGEDLARNIDSVAGGSSHVANRLVELRDASVSTGAAASQVLSSAEALELQAEGLRNKATHFLAQVRNNARSAQA